MKPVYIVLAALVFVAPLKAQDLPPFFKEGTIITFKADGLKMSQWDTFKIMEIKGKWLRLQCDSYGTAPADVVDAIKTNPYLVEYRYKDVGWFSVDKMNNIIEIK